MTRWLRWRVCLDRLVGALLLLPGAPVIGLLALAIRIADGQRGLIALERVGQHGRRFRMWKLRTMRATEADGRAAGAAITSGDDDRVTPIGRRLRHWRIDELPQLWNVVKGDMSLVGPRPPLPSEYQAYHDAVHRRLRVRPGLTGLWQVSGRADLTWEESVRLDLRYVDNWSIALDLQILWKTAKAVLRGSGAY
jgi:lipopolysaccharide/colanic/teichoic acid biosynthesis glycosyltransferase